MCCLWTSMEGSISVGWRPQWTASVRYAAGLSITACGDIAVQAEGVELLLL